MLYMYKNVCDCYEAELVDVMLYHCNIHQFDWFSLPESEFKLILSTLIMRKTIVIRKIGNDHSTRWQNPKIDREFLTLQQA